MFDPMSEFDRLQEEINKLFNFDRIGDSSGLFDRRTSPALDLVENADDFVITCDLPGIDPKDLEVSIANNVLTVKGEKKEEKESKDAKVYRKESWAGTFQRTVSLPHTVDPNKINAELKNGVLKVTLGKKEEVKPKQIAVTVK